jgi:hypothetical protein
MYKMPVKTKGNWLSLKLLLRLLMEIEIDASNREDLPIRERPSLLTSDARDTWAKSRQSLLQGN